jgi:hypothetical protein
MALQPCRECGQQISAQAASCPHCGAPNPAASRPVASKGDKRRSRGVWIFLFVVFVVLAVGSLLPDSGRSGSSEDPTVDLRVAAVPSGRLMKVASGESESVSDCRIRINHDGLSGGYQYHLGALSPNEEREVFLNEFLNGTERFDPERTAVTFLTVSCQTSRGRGYWGWKRR